VSVELDHLVYGVEALDEAIERLAEHLGIRPSPGGRHEGMGTHNAILGLDHGTYLELLAPDPSQPERAQARPFGLDGASLPRLVGWAVRTDDIEATVADAARAGVDVGPVVAMSRAKPDGTVLHWRLTMPAAGVLPFLIEWGDAPHPSADAPSGAVLRSFRAEVPDVAATRRALAALGLDLDVSEASEPGLVAVLHCGDLSVELR
jgi:hypothetical protein